jgi:hypothetical protein
MEISAQQNEALYKDEYLCVYYDNSTNCIVKEWQQAVSENKFKELIIQLLFKIIEARSKYKKNLNLLADCRKLNGEVFTNEIIDWLNTNVHSIYVMNKIAKKAFLISSDIATNISLIKYVKNAKLDDNFTMNVFENIEDAKKWLTE